MGKSTTELKIPLVGSRWFYEHEDRRVVVISVRITEVSAYVEWRYENEPPSRNWPAKSAELRCFVGSQDPDYKTSFTPLPEILVHRTYLDERGSQEVHILEVLDGYNVGRNCIIFGRRRMVVREGERPWPWTAWQYTRGESNFHREFPTLKDEE